MDLAFTTRLPLAVLIVLGVKGWENRSCCPSPRTGRCGMSVSRGSNESEYNSFLEFIKKHSSARLIAAIPAWKQVEGWRGKMIAEMDYEVSESAGPEIWNEGYRYWWRLYNVKMLDEPYVVRGNVGMWGHDGPHRNTQNGFNTETQG